MHVSLTLLVEFTMILNQTLWPFQAELFCVESVLKIFVKVPEKNFKQSLFLV